MTTYRFGVFSLHKEHLLLHAASRQVHLGPRVVETLLALIEHPGEIVTKNELLERVWPEGYVEEANLAQNIYVLRKTLRQYADRDLIETVPRRGYRFTAEVREEEELHTRPLPAAPAIAVPRVRPVFERYRIAAAAAVLLVAILAGLPFALAHSRKAAATAQLSAQGARMYAMGKYYWNQRTATSLRKSEQYFLSTIASDPKDARGYAGLASAYAIESDYRFNSDWKAELAKAAAYAREALRLDPQSAEAHAVLGLVDVQSHRLASAYANYKTALALDPGFAPAHQWYGSELLLSGHVVQAYGELQKAANLDPLSVATTDWLAQAAFLTRRYDAALAYGRQALDLSPQRYMVYQTIGLAYEQLGNERAAIAAFKTYAARCGPDCKYDVAALLANAYAKLHDPAHAGSELAIAHSGLAQNATPPEDYAAALIALGKRNDALHVLARGKIQEPAAVLAVDPRMDAVRGDARFRRYMQSPG